MRQPWAFAIFSALAPLLACDSYDAGLLDRLIGGPDSGVGPPAYRQLCGNGQRDEDELCDTALAEGEDGACPTTCPDDACFRRAVAGRDCQTQCVGLEITAALNDDGCCPEDVSPAEDSDCGVCGDRIVGPKETCDPPESCRTPDDCATTTSACLRTVYSGSPESCTSRCNLERVDACANGDGCCPPDCNSESDNDCSASCGNGLVELQAGETCEPASETQACPQSCDDRVACTEDLMTGSAHNCNVACANLAITIPASGDGCCPDGANAINDSDCMPRCGNQVRELPETCDPCPDSCADQDPCTIDSMSGDRADCSAECTRTTITQATHGDSCCPSGKNANDDSDCSPQCGNGVTEPGEACDGGPLCRSCQRIFNSSLVHRYDFGGSGTGVTDSVGSSHGTVVGGSLSGSGTVNLTGGSSGPYVDLPDGLISALGNATVEVWLTWRGGNAWQRVFDFGNSSGGSATSEWFVSPCSSTSEVFMAMNFTSSADDVSNDEIAKSSPCLAQNAKRHIAAVFDDQSDTARLFIDGALVATNTGVTGHLSAIHDVNVWIGRSNYGNDELNAIVHEFRIYDKALSASEIKASYDASDNP